MAAFRLLIVASALACVCLSSGCASAGTYLAQRGRDAADIFTMTLGVGDGASVRAGPVHVSAIISSDLIGLKGGQWFANGNDLSFNEQKLAFLPIPRSEDWHTCRKDMEELEKLRAKAEGREWKRRKYLWDPNLFGSEIFVQDQGEPCDVRGKNIMANSPFPFYVASENPAYWTQFEISGGVLLSLRAGFNPGELLDFILGWTGVDIYCDDVK
jgi:hypothetical protein